MTWKPGESGNPAGRAPRGKTYADVLRAALEKPDSATGKKNLEVIAEKAIALAKEGEAWAIGHVAERLDGKPDSMINMRMIAERGSDVREYSDAELLSLIAKVQDEQARTHNGPATPQ
jgi:hypothetical protein